MNTVEDTLFIEGLKEGNLSKIRSATKGDVHNHCSTGMRFTTFNKWAKGSANKAPEKMDGVAELNSYIFNEVTSRVKTGKDVEFLVEAAVKEAIEDGVNILETSIDCHDILAFENRDDFFKTIANIKSKYSSEIDFRPEIGMAITTPKNELDECLVPSIESGVFMHIDAYGEETLEGYNTLAPYYKYAREKGLKLKVHAGQFLCEDHVKAAIELLEVDELQHGIGAATSDYLIDLIKERNIRLNICPSSNNILGSVKDITKHPIRKLFDKGVNVTINTDDLLLFDVGLSEEFLKLYNLGLFTPEELNQIRKAALK
ncbi:MAG: hypothetical protein RR539_09085 [Clostridium sp.]|uniref:hypothetical protein n=1 Tax=Clostridium sp. TaxID=1506 RepID=UPI002FCAFC1E